MERILNSKHVSNKFLATRDIWWVFAFSGLLSIIFGGMAIYSPIDIIVIMTIIFGVYLIIDGVLYIISGIIFANKDGQKRDLVIGGVLSIAFGLLIMLTPHLISLELNIFLWTILSFWAIAAGLSEISAARRLRREIKGEWILALSGLLSVVLGTFMLFYIWVNPITSLEMLGLVIGWYSLISGSASLLLAFKLLTLE